MELDLTKMEGVQTVKLLKNPDFKVFIEKLKDLETFYSVEIAKLLNNHVKREDLDQLNQFVAERNVLRTLLYVKDELEDEISPYN